MPRLRVAPNFRRKISAYGVKYVGASVHSFRSCQFISSTCREDFKFIGWWGVVGDKRNLLPIALSKSVLFKWITLSTPFCWSVALLFYCENYFKYCPKNSACANKPEISFRREREMRTKKGPYLTFDLARVKRSNKKIMMADILPCSGLLAEDCLSDISCCSLSKCVPKYSRLLASSTWMSTTFSLEEGW